jgi:hypothetical protein
MRHRGSSVAVLHQLSSLSTSSLAFVFFHQTSTLCQRRRTQCRAQSLSGGPHLILQTVQGSFRPIQLDSAPTRVAALQSRSSMARFVRKGLCFFLQPASSRAWPAQGSSANLAHACEDKSDGNIEHTAPDLLPPASRWSNGNLPCLKQIRRTTTVIA